ncbi:VOC family protein [Nocardia spumae]|uniref:VOC family protein n=1 Tax=Nocardia spumae TaxID=2887190 RepID=UPI001D137A21|nr:VOC family protein [Nocardia spumae]
MHLTQIRLVVRDFAGCVTFYRDIIGLTPQFDDPRPPYVAFKPELGSALALHDRADLAATLGAVLRPAASGADAAMVSLRVDDLAGYIALLRERGAEILSGPVEYDGRIRCAYLRDPEGNLIEIQQWLATRAGEPVPPAR